MSTIHISALDLYDLLKLKLGDKEAKALVEYVDESAEKTIEKQKKIVATKEELQLNLKGVATKEDITGVKEDLKENIAGVKEDLKEDIANLRENIANVKAEMIKWMFIFWASSIATLGGLMFALLKAYVK